MDGITPEGLLIIIAITLSIWAGGEVVKGAKWAGHKTKCGVMHVVGKHCAPTDDIDRDEP
jgi:hypothetical protein